MPFFRRRTGTRTYPRMIPSCHFPMNPSTTIPLSEYPEDLTGLRFTRLLVLRQFDRTRPIEFHNRRWICLCDCANGDESKVIVAHRSRLIRGQVKSCGCLKERRLAEGRWKHGFASKDCQHPLYSTWEGIIARCYNPNFSTYYLYGARGITVCDEWRHSFPNFLESMGPTWKEGLSIDRKHPDDNYSLETCKWSTPKEQANNRRNNVRYEINGETKTLAQWCEQYQIPPNTIQSRRKRGWSIEEAITTPAAKQDRSEKVGSLTFNGKTQSVAEWSKETGIPVNTIYMRRKNDWPVEKILTTPNRKRKPNNWKSLPPQY